MPIPKNIKKEKNLNFKMEGVSENYPILSYGNTKRRLLKHDQYILLKAGIENRTYNPEEFEQRIKAVEFEHIYKYEPRTLLERRRLFLLLCAEFAQESGNVIQIKGLNKTEEKNLESFVNKTFRKILRDAANKKQ